MVNTINKTLWTYILMSLILFGLINITTHNSRKLEPVEIDLQEYSNFIPDNRQTIVGTSNYLLFASNQSEFDLWKIKYPLVSEYQNLMALEVVLTRMEYSEVIKASKIKPVKSDQFRAPIEVEHPLSQLSHSTLNGVDEANTLKVSDLWDLGYNGTGVVVAVFDNGINFSHPALIGQNQGDPVLFNEVGGQTYAPCKNHGTPVAGLIVSTGVGGYSDTNGTAFGSRIVDMQFGCDASDNLLGDPIAGFDWLAGQNNTIKVVNLSWGKGNPSNPAGLEFEAIINKLNELGIVVVVSAGNVEDTRYLGEEFTILDPASAIGAITVGAVDSSNVPTSFSALGPNVKYLSKPDIVAPGKSIKILSSTGSYDYKSGTSFSAPLVTGAIATLISGLDDLNIPWNVGTIKAALMRGATSLPYDELQVGQGLVNLNSTWQYLMNADIDERGPLVLEATPSNGPYQMFETFPGETVGYIPISIISSHPDLVKIEIMGNLSQIISHNSQLNPDYSQAVYLKTNTMGIIEGRYTGFINVSLGSDFVLSDFTVIVSDTSLHKVLVDLRHTEWDTNGNDNIGGYNIGEIIKLGQTQGLWFHEVNSILTSDLLSGYDIVWLPDPFDLPDGVFNNPAPILQSELDALSQFVHNGGSMFIDFNGNELINGGLYGPNSTELNSLISQFDITANLDPSSYSEGSISTIHNVSSFTAGVLNITHFGNYLEIGPMAQNIASDSKGVTIASYQNDKGGKVLVSSTNFWLDNSGVHGGYDDFGQIGDKLLSNNLWRWLRNNDSIIIIEDKSSQNEINIDFKVQTRDPNSNPKLMISWVEYGKNETNQIPFSIIGEYINFNYKFVIDGEYEILIEYGNEYQRLFFTAPKVSTEPVSNPSSSSTISVSNIITLTTPSISQGRESSGFITISSTLILFTLVLLGIPYRKKKRSG